MILLSGGHCIKNVFLSRKEKKIEVVFLPFYDSCVNKKYFEILFSLLSLQFYDAKTKCSAIDTAVSQKSSLIFA